jgi:hypothetical protein
MARRCLRNTLCMSLTPNGRYYTYMYTRQLSDLYVMSRPK